ncbi:MAG: hypothetical protein ACFE9D_08600 [Promethearchaeota archaeon]
MSSLSEPKSEPQPQKPLWQRLSITLNLNDIPRLLRATDFWAGIIVRLATFFAFYMFLNVAGDLTDMNELVFKGMVNLLHGVNPYGQTYLLSTFAGSYTQDYFNYPPFAILFHLPTALWLGPHSIGTMDFMPAFFLLHWFFDFVTFYRLWQNEHRVISKVIWMNPFFVFVNVITFMSLPLMLLTLMLINLDKPVRSGAYAVLVAATYQMGAVFIPFILIYHWKAGQLRWSFLGMLPFLLITLLFFFWNPILFVRDLLVMQVGRPHINWLDNNSLSPYYNRYYPLGFLFMGSIPSWVFNIGIGLGLPPPLSPQIAYVMMLMVMVFAIFGLVYFIKNLNWAQAILIPGLLLAFFIASTAEGLAHYWVLCITLPFLFWRHRDSLYAAENTQDSLNRTTTVSNREGTS